MAISLTVPEFLSVENDELTIDVRSPGEYEHGHIPGAINIPLLNNDERRIIGTCYKREGREQAVIKGFELVGHKFAEYVKQVLALSPSKKIRVYCWRGGLRSNIMAWIMNISGFKVSLLKGGYKAYRTYVQDVCSKDYKLLVVGGKTGSGKTELLHLVSSHDRQVIDLEGLANHKGSAFGGLGQEVQPTYEHFENLLATALMKCDSSKTIWLENESRLIGSVKIPDILYDNIRRAPVLEISIPQDIRVNRLAKEYGHFDPAVLAENTMKLTKRLGHLRMTTAVEKLLTGDIKGWITDVLSYYDKTYSYGKSLRDASTIRVVELPDDQFAAHLNLIFDTADSSHLVVSQS